MKKEIELCIYSVPPKNLENDIKRIMINISKYFGKNPALYCQPHITMRSGLIIPAERISRVVFAIKKEFSPIKKPIIKIRNTSIYDGKEVLTIQLEIKNKKSIENVYKKLEKLFPEYTRGYIINKFNPHISLAWNVKSKLSEDQIKNSLEFVKNIKINEDYTLDKLYLYKKVKNKFIFFQTIS